MTLAPGAADTGIVFRRIDLIAARSTSRRRAENVGDTTLGTTLDPGRRASVSTDRAPDVGVRRARHRQRVRRPHGARSADHGRQRGPVRVPAAVRRHRGAERAEALRPHPEARRGRKTATSGRGSSLRRLQASTSRSSSITRCSQAALADRVDGLLDDSFLKEVSRARTFGFMQDLEVHARARTWRSAATSTTRSCSTSTASSTRTACATRTSSCKHKILDAIGDLYLLGHMR